MSARMITTTDYALFRAFTAKTGRIDSSTKEVLRYSEALWEGYNELKTGNLRNIHK